MAGRPKRIMENEIATLLREMVQLMGNRADAQEEFQQRLLEEIRQLNRTLESMEKRKTVGDL